MVIERSKKVGKFANRELAAVEAGMQLVQSLH
jgi:hypothetical protein